MRQKLMFLLRTALWLSLSLITVRGAAAMLFPTPTHAAPAAPVRAPVDTESARSFAVLFTHEYLLLQPEGAADRARRLAPFLAAGLDPRGGVSPSGPPVTQRVAIAVPWDFRVLTEHRAQVTVLAQVVNGADGVPRQVALAVPVALSEGRYVVYDYPAFVPIPAVGQVRAPLYGGASVPDALPAVRDLLAGFLRAYAQGTQAEMAYFLVPGARINGLGGSARFVELGDLQVLQTDSEYWAVAEVVLHDPGAGASFRQRLLLRLERRERWYVADMQQKGE